MARGQYRLAGQPLGADHVLVAAACTAPHGVICPETALVVHGVGPQLLRDAWQDDRVTIEEFQAAAQACRVKRVMKPYLETIAT